MEHSDTITLVTSNLAQNWILKNLADTIFAKHIWFTCLN